MAVDGGSGHIGTPVIRRPGPARPWSWRAASSPHRTDCCQLIRWRELGVKRGFACPLTRCFHLCSLSCGHSRPLMPYRRRITIRRQSGGGSLHLPRSCRHGPGGHRRGRFAGARSSVVVVIVRRLHQLRWLSVSRGWGARVAGGAVGLVRRSGSSGQPPRSRPRRACGCGRAHRSSAARMRRLRSRSGTRRASPWPAR